MIDRTAPPWNAAPADCTDYDAATWWHMRRQSELAGQDPMPAQSLEEWCARMRASRAADTDRYVSDTVGALATVRLSDVPELRVDWLAEGMIPWGALTQVVGRGGQGKTTFAAHVGARLTRGQPVLPGMSPPAPADVLIVSAEDSIQHVLVPRLRLAGADLERVHVWNLNVRDLVLPDGIDELARHVHITGARLLILDPLAAFLSSKTDTHRDAGIRGVLRPLHVLAERERLAILGILHVNQAQGGDVAVRVSGSGAWINAARSALVFGPPPDTEEGDPRRVVAVAKSNYAPLGTAHELTLKVPPGEEHPTIVYVGSTAVRATDVLGTPSDDEERSSASECSDWLAAELANGERPARDLQSAAESAGFSKKALRMAKERRRVKSRREGFGPGSRVFWSLPQTPIDATGSLRENQGTNGTYDIDDQELQRLQQLAIGGDR